MFKLTFIINVSSNNQSCQCLDDRFRAPALRARLLLLPGSMDAERPISAAPAPAPFPIFLRLRPY